MRRTFFGSVSIMRSVIAILLLTLPASTLLAQRNRIRGNVNYHRWLTPEEFADRFGVSQDDIDKIVSWLRGQGLTVVSVARARNSVAFRGDAAQVENAFGIK